MWRGRLGAAPQTSQPDDLLLRHLAETMGDGVWGFEFLPVVTFNFFFDIHPSSEATATSVKGTLNASQGKCSDKPHVKRNAERDVRRLFENSGLSLPVPIQEIEHECGLPDLQPLRSFHIRPTDWVKHWMDSCPELLGGCAGPANQNFEAFWKLYEMEHPQHEVFSAHKGDLSRVVPLFIHGDEGRSVKKTGYLVVSVESPLGSHKDPRIPAGCSCSSFMASRPDLPKYGTDSNLVDGAYQSVGRKQLTNFKGHSYLSRWLIFGLGGWVYKKHRHVADRLFEELTADMQRLFQQGVLLENGQRVFGALVGIKGDLDFHAKYMNLTRCYSHLGSKNKIEICHSCRAGHQLFPFEDYSETPAWVPTMFYSRPWDRQSPPALGQMNFDLHRPELAIAWDPFHVVKVGVARDVIGGTLIFLLRKGFFDDDGDSKNIVDRFSRAHSVFTLWCKAERESPGLRSFTKAFFNMQNLMSAPWCSSKASDTRLLLRWLVWYLRLNIANPRIVGHHQLLQHMLEVCQSTLDINILHHHGLWLERVCAHRLYCCIMTCLRGYAYLGVVAIQHRIRSFIQKPKLHALHHIAYKLRVQLLKGSTLIMSPQAHACDVNEDFIGRISRLSRRVGFRLCDKRVCERYFLKIAALLKDRKKDGLKGQLAFSKPKRKLKRG